MVSTTKTLDLVDILRPEMLAGSISNTYLEWNTYRAEWLEQKRELRNYIFATDTRSTSNSKLPWKNSTTIPKLCQIRDNLHANYMAALFPNDEWLEWDGDNQDAIARDKSEVIKAYVLNKVRASNLKSTVSDLVLDWIDYGNIFATTIFVDESVTNDKTGEVIAGYVGPKLMRISPNDIVFNPIASSFSSSPKIVRTLKSIGELKDEVETFPENSEARAAFARAREVRGALSQVSQSDNVKSNGYQVDGFGSYQQYFSSGMVEILTFYGDMYDTANDKLYRNHEIAIIDRSFVLYNRPIDNWLGKEHIFHHGWRKRPDNLYAMGPLDNLVGMQYRIDHLENLKADAFDMIAFPMQKVLGEVMDYTYAPGERIYVGDEGDVTFMHPDTTALNADTQIQLLENKMEEMAGAPKQAMGFRTAGEKTAYEVQSLENAAGRIFQNKTLDLETEFLAKVLNSMLEIGRRYMSDPELLKMLSSDIDITVFKSITKDDLVASGKLRPVGASHFAKRNLMIQNLTQFLGSPIGQDPSVNVHISGKALAKAAEEVLGLDRFGLFRDNVRIFEQVESQKLMNAAQQQVELEDQTEGLEPSEEDIPLDE